MPSSLKTGANFSLKDITSYSQEGDSFGAADLNRTNSKINDLTDSLEELTSSGLGLNATFLGQFTLQKNDSKDVGTLSDSLGNYKYILAMITTSNNYCVRCSVLIPNLEIMYYAINNKPSLGWFLNLGDGNGIASSSVSVEDDVVRGYTQHDTINRLIIFGLK